MRELLVVVLLTGVLLASALGACAKDYSLETLVNWMTGSFSSERQAAADSSYYDIRLEMAQIWKDADDEHWIYVEQAVAGATDRPYRQRVYRVTPSEQRVYSSEVYTLPNPEACVGAWAEEQPLSDLTPDDLELRKGCAVLLERVHGGEFEGGTMGAGCESTLRGAAYATSEVSVGPLSIASWDRGFDENGEQVWGAEKGGYVFDRVWPHETMGFEDLTGDAADSGPRQSPGRAGCCYVYDDYTVLAWDSVPPKPVAIVRKRDPESDPAAADCTPDSLSGDFVVRNEWAEYFAGMWDDLLLIDSGTSNIRSLYIYDVPDQKKVLHLEGTGGIDGWEDDTRLRMWLMSGAEVPRSLCPDISDGFGVAIDSLYLVDLEAYTVTPLGPWRCRQTQ